MYSLSNTLISHLINKVEKERAYAKAASITKPNKDNKEKGLPYQL